MADNTNLYISKLPYNKEMKLCQILDSNSSWEILAEKHMGYDVITLHNLRQEILCNHSPTAKLLKMWGSLNHKILELFTLLYRMQHFQAMEVIKDHVDEEYHFLIFENVVDHDGNANATSVRQTSHHSLHPIAATGRCSTTNETLDSNTSTVVASARSIPQRPYDEIQRSAYNWDPRRILGRGGFSTVWYGVWKCTQVAIKRIKQKEEDNLETQKEQIRQTFMELHYSNFYRHDNILPLYSYSFNGIQPCLVFQYMPGGSLKSRLRTEDPSKSLNWSKRLNIAVGTARGLQFLHTGSDKPLIHGDIKSDNILLDSNDNAKIGDFGLACEGPESNNAYIRVNKNQGTLPYLPDEYLLERKMSTKVDTYSFGVVLFEIATGLRAFSKNREDKNLKDYVVNFKGDIDDLKDRRIQNSDTCYKGLIDIGKLCISRLSQDRPDMVEVLILLEEIVL